MAILRSKLKNKRPSKFLFHRDLNHGSLDKKASVRPMSYADPKQGKALFIDQYFYGEKQLLFDISHKNCEVLT